MARGRFVKRKKAEKLNITSLMDALTIILIFLLVNYSEVTEDSELPKFINLPTVVGKASKAKIGVPLVIGQNKIEIGKGRFVNFSNFESEENKILVQIKDELQLLKEDAVTRGLATVDGNAKTSLKISIHADKDVPYKWINSIVEMCAGMGLNFIDFIAGSKQE